MTVTTDRRPATPPTFAEAINDKALIAELREFARTTIARIAAKAGLAQNAIGSPSDLVNEIVVKLMNGEEALCKGHAVIRNRKLRLTEEARADPVIAARYSAGLRRWDRQRVPLKKCLQLAILSEVRNVARKLMDRRNVRLQPDAGVTSAERFGREQAELEMESLLDSLGNARARQVGRALLAGATRVDVCLELRLSPHEFEAVIEEIRRHVERIHAPSA